MRKMKMLLLGIGIICSGLFENVKAGIPDYTETVENNQNKSILHQINTIYNSLDFGQDKPLSKDVFAKGYIGYLNIKAEDKLSRTKNILSIADYSLSANEKRLWVIDLDQKKILFHSLVAHGQGTGEEYAQKFSNVNNSHQTSLGFFITEETYMGGNGYSLKLEGLDKNYNDNAYKRAIVIHGADYVSHSFIQNNKRLGRSWGCPAVPTAEAEKIINTIKEKTCFFAYYPNEKFLASSKWLKYNPYNSEIENISDQFVKRKKHTELLASADLIKTKVEDEKNLDEVSSSKEQKPMFEGIYLNTPDTL